MIEETRVITVYGKMDIQNLLKEFAQVAINELEAYYSDFFAHDTKELYDWSNSEFKGGLNEEVYLIFRNHGTHLVRATEPNYLKAIKDSYSNYSIKSVYHITRMGEDAGLPFKVEKILWDDLDDIIKELEGKSI